MSQMKRSPKGSRLRCLQSTSFQNQGVADFLTRLVTPHARVDSEACWMPRGPLAPKEAKLGESNGFLSEEQQKEVTTWWLTNSGRSNTPNWDLASQCTIGERKGLILVEAKAHPSESPKIDPCRAKDVENCAQIQRAINDANAALSAVSPHWTWGLNDRTHYQLSNRFAWAWKVASLGVPIILVYLGFIRAMDMETDSRDIFATAQAWKEWMAKYSAGVVPPTAWEMILDVNGTPLIPLIRAAEVTVKAEVLGS